MPAAAPRIVFYAPVSDIRLLDLLEFYAEDLSSLENLGCHVHRTNSMADAIRSEGDLLWAWWWHSSCPVMAAWRLRGRPVIGTGAAQLFGWSEKGRVRMFGRSCLTIAGIHLATTNIAVSQTEALRIRRIRRSRIECVPHAVDTTFYRPGTWARDPRAMVVAQLNAASIKRKGVDTALRAVERIRRSLPEFRLVVAGPMSADGRIVLEQLRREVNFDGIDVLGEVSREEKRHRLGEAWFYLQPSLYEAFGVSVVEAMACGAVPICSHGGALPEVIGDAGLVLPVASPDAVAHAVEVLAGDRDRLLRLGRKAQARAQAFDRGEHTRAVAGVLAKMGFSLEPT